jgi:ribosomal protein L14E/L6E/L27E
MNGISIGQIVHSRAGRDKDRFFIVVSLVNEEYVLIADGDLRKINNPKKKKIKHLVLHDVYAEGIKSMLLNNQRVVDADLRKALSQKL